MSRGALAVAVAWLGLALVVFAIAAPRTDSPGLYYDEAFLGQQAKDFFEPGREVAHAHSTREVRVFGRTFPLRNAVYLGSLKSQLLIPAFALFGTDVAVLRLATLATSLVAVLFVLLWARRILGTAPALAGAVLIVSDPVWWFLSLCEWGPFTTLLLCRAAGFFCLTLGWGSRRLAPIVVGGLLLGLGVYARADFLLVLAGAALALVLVRPGLVREALHARRRLLVALAVATAVGAAPMLVSAADLLQLIGNPVLGRRGDLGEKLRVLWSLADGSHFHRLMQAGGHFNRALNVEARGGPFGFVALAALALAAARAVERLRRREPLDGAAFLLLASLLVTAGTLALPGAVRAHHLMNAFPFPQLLVASVGVALVRDVPRRAMRIAVVAVGAGLVLANATTIRATYRLVEATGGRGWWTDALREPAAELDARPTGRGVSLDWGFHQPLLFLTHRATLLEPIWGIRDAARTEAGWRFEGRAGDVYFVHDRDFDLFDFGPGFLAAARHLAERSPDALTIRSYRDREGGLAFHTVRLSRDHEITYRRVFRIRLREGD